MAESEGNIVTFGRMRPSKRLASSSFAINHLDKQIEFFLPKDAEYINNRRDKYAFQFNGGFFDANTKQHEVFERVALPIAKSVLEGYNATIFCYGQTGSGKTFTITGGPDDYNQRGLIPRTLSFVFSEIGQHKDWATKIYISYLELYNDKGFDLLDNNRDESRRLEDLPQVTMMDDMDGHIQFNGLSALPCVNEEEALNLLFLGDTNRVMCETPMNDASSRSHCIFTINIESARIGSDVVRKSKLHLVDLAGSERGASFKIGSTKILNESKHINLSLHYLEMCITALHDRAIHPERHTHVPYRNCMMTSVLKDSLGGNCKTAMIATMSGELDNFNESISTCSFASRVASIKNKAQINEEVDPRLVIRRLKQQVQELKEELAVLRGEKIYRSGALSGDEKERCMQLVQSFLATGNTATKRDGEEDETGGLPVGDPKKLAEVFRIFRGMILAGGGGGGASSGGATAAGASGGSGVDSRFALPPPDFTKSPEYQRMQQTISTQKQQISTQNHEINTLVCILRDREKATKSGARPPSEAGHHAAAPVPADAHHSVTVHGASSSSSLAASADFDFAAARSTPVPQHAHAQSSSMAPPAGVLSSAQLTAIQAITSAHGSGGGGGSVARTLSHHGGGHSGHGASGTGGGGDDDSVGPDHTRWLMERNAQFEEFKRTHRKSQVIAENQEVLRDKYSTAKQWATEVNGARDHINALKEKIAQLRVERAAQGLVDSASGDDADIEQHMAEMQQYQAAYKEKFVALKGVKSEIEHLQHILEKSRKELQRDFEQWWAKRGGGAHAGESTDSKDDEHLGSSAHSASSAASAKLPLYAQPPPAPQAYYAASAAPPQSAPSQHVARSLGATTPVSHPHQSQPQLQQSHVQQYPQPPPQSQFYAHTQPPQSAPAVPSATPSGSGSAAGAHLMPSIAHLPPAQQAQMQQIFAACGYNPQAFQEYMHAAQQQQQQQQQLALMRQSMSTPQSVTAPPSSASSSQQLQQQAALYQQQMAYYNQYAAAVAAAQQQQQAQQQAQYQAHAVQPHQPPVTGNAKADDEIAKFYRMRSANGL